MDQCVNRCVSRSCVSRSYVTSCVRGLSCDLSYDEACPSHDEACIPPARVWIVPPLLNMLQHLYVPPMMKYVPSMTKHVPRTRKILDPPQNLASKPDVNFSQAFWFCLVSPCTIQAECRPESLSRELFYC